MIVLNAILRLSALLAAMLVLATAAAHGDDDNDKDGDRRRQRPNILVFVSDDQGSFDMGYQGSRIRTPNIDRLAEEGARL